MDESKHTPGPWHVDEDTRPGMAWNRHIYGPDGNAVCFMAHSDGRNVQRDQDNAALIASAPDLAAEVEELRAENDKLRAKLGNSPEPCAYCGIPADKLLDCQHGFPGCPRADDMVLCGHFGAAMDAAGLRADLDAERRKVEVLRDLWPVIEHAMAGLVFTGDKAGEVAAQMAAARAALASTEGGAK